MKVETTNYKITMLRIREMAGMIEHIEGKISEYARRLEETGGASPWEDEQITDLRKFAGRDLGRTVRDLYKIIDADELRETMTDETLRKRVAEAIESGLFVGSRLPRPKEPNIANAICSALGERITHEPSVVAPVDIEFAIALNDADWSSPRARAEGLLPLALAQLNTAGTDRRAWIEAVRDGATRRLVPKAFWYASQIHPEKKHRRSLENVAKACERLELSTKDKCDFTLEGDVADAATLAAKHAGHPQGTPVWEACSNASLAVSSVERVAYHINELDDGRAGRILGRIAEQAKKSAPDSGDSYLLEAVDIAVEAYAANLPASS